MTYSMTQKLVFLITLIDDGSLFNCVNQVEIGIVVCLFFSAAACHTQEHLLHPQSKCHFNVHVTCLSTVIASRTSDKLLNFLFVHIFA